ncbi:Secreted protein [Streptomyces ambofaciens ATCC 23877]|uniref:Secreted protein n=2 Tax=Streptomyces ambofaciens TaxID=1889 RepID=A0A0K2AWA4_STRA7|nr:Secreted protein [Streptomyces ambofaciens ATCC 23877]
MQRRAQCDQRAKRLPRVVCAAAAVPLMLVAAGCSSDSGSGDAKDKAADKPAASKSASPTPTVEAAAYAKLPEPCAVLAKKTLKDLVPKADSGKEGASNDTATRGSCSWDSLDDNGVDGSQFRWLSVSMLRFDSDATRGAGDDLAHDYYTKQLQDVQSAEGAKSLKTTPVSGTGDEASVVRYDLKKKEGTFKQQTVVARVENVVVTVDYNGAGLAGDETPDADDLVKDARKAAEEAVAAVTKANGGGGTGGAKSPSQSASGSASASGSTSKSPSKESSKASSKASSKTS